MAQPTANISSPSLPPASAITLFSVDGRALFVSQLHGKDQDRVRQVFARIVNRKDAGTWVYEVADHNYVDVTQENAGEGDYETVLRAASTALSTTPEIRQRGHELLAKAQVWTPFVGEGFSLVSDLSSGVRNAMDVANKTNAVAKTCLGATGGSANVVVAGLIMKGAVEQYNAAAVAKDEGGKAEAILTGMMGFALAVVGLAMILFFSGTIGAQFLFTAAFVLYAITGARCVYILEYLREFRSGLTQILESTEYEDDQRKLQAALAYLEPYTATPELRNKLARRVGADCALDLETRLPTLIQRVGVADLKEAQELVQQVLDANRELMAKQFLLFAIATIGVLTYTAGVGLAWLPDLTVSKLSVALNVLWLFVDHQAMSVKGWSLGRVWSELTRKAHSVYTRNIKHWKGTKIYRKRTESLIHVPRRISESEVGLANQEFKLKLKQYDDGDDNYKNQLMQDAIAETTKDIDRGFKIVISDKEFYRGQEPIKESLGHDIVQHLKVCGLSDRDIFILMSHFEPATYYDVLTLSPAFLGYNEQPKIPVGHRLGIRLPKSNDQRIFRVEIAADKTAKLTNTTKVEVVTSPDPMAQTHPDTTVHATKQVQFTLNVPSAELTLTVL